MQLPDLTSFDDLVLHREIIQVKQRPDLFHFKLKLILRNGSVLFARENHLPGIDWHEYSYQWQTADNQLIHRWDNAHERYLDAIPAHHQHVGTEENIQPSVPMTFDKVLTFIASHLNH